MLRGFGVTVDENGHIPHEARRDLHQKALIVLIELEPASCAAPA